MTYVGIKVFDHNGFLIPKLDQGLLQVWDVIQDGGGGGGYALMSRVIWTLYMNLQLTMFGPWRSINSMLHPFGLSWTTRYDHPCTPPASVVDTGKHTTT